jgi:cell division protein ZapA
MSEVTVEVAGRAYRLGCGEGEEDHLAGLAALIDAEAKALVRQFGQMPEGRLLLMTALMVTDRLAESESRNRDAVGQVAAAKKLAESRSQPSDMFGPEQEERLARKINQLVQQIEGAARPAD